MKRILFIPILIFGTFLLVVYLAVPQYQKFLFLQKEVKEKTSILAQKKQYFEGLKEKSKELAQYEETLETIGNALPQDPSLLSFLSFLEDKVQEVGLVLASVNMTPNSGSVASKGAVALKSHSVSLSLLGSLSSIEDFLKVLEASSRLVEVEGLSFSGAQSNIQDSLNKFNLSLTVFSY